MAICKNCTKNFSPHRMSKGIFCSLTCYHINMKGKSHGHKTNNGIKAWNKGLKMPQISGVNHFAWKGDQTSYRSLHRWVERHLGKANKCMKNPLHISSRYHWANISKEYKRDLEDWMQMCPSCNCRDRIGRRVSP